MRPTCSTQLLEQGATELSVEQILPPDIDDREPRPGDDDLALLCCRRLTIEWVLRNAVTAEPGVDWRGGVGVAGLVADGTDVRGLRLEDGTTVEADLVVVGGGPQLARAGVDHRTRRTRPTDRAGERGRHHLHVALLSAPRGHASCRC